MIDKRRGLRRPGGLRSGDERHDLTDGQWAALEPLLPVTSGRGRPPKWSKRQLIDGIRWRIRTGAPWRDVRAARALVNRVWPVSPLAA
ncbi:transposase [Nonomuraea sp. NPDC059194]|uniref:transposase n=1 Tax=Nonomuraea sp. NPDC059194 TaxID=3346764 RepID=UPI00368B8CCC